jgi:calreticulin
MKLSTLLLAGAATAKEYFKDDFSDPAWESRWIQSEHKSDYGAFSLEAGKWNEYVGLKTSQDAKFYANSASFESFGNKDKTTVIQFSVQHQQKIDCGGGYVKVFPSSVTAADMHGDSEYNVMFGPDICGYSTKKVHVIFRYKGKNHLINKDIKCKDDELTHIYTLVISPDNTYKVLIDNAEAASGGLDEDWDFLPPKKIKDPDASKPTQEEWDEREEVPDPSDTKPEDWDVPEHIADPDADKPDDWDEEMDGEWEPPQIDNPDFKGDWKPKMMKNPAFKGKWVHPEIDNPEYVDDKEIYAYDDFGLIGLDLWQVKSGTVFSNFLITDSVDEASEDANRVLELMKEEKAKKDDEDAAAKAAEPEDDPDDEDDDSMGDLDDEDDLGDYDVGDYDEDEEEGDYDEDDDLDDLGHDEL